MKRRSVSVLSVFARHALNFPSARRQGAGHLRPKLSSQFILLCEAFEFHFLKFNCRVYADYPMCDSVFRQKVRQFTLPIVLV